MVSFFILVLSYFLSVVAKKKENTLWYMLSFFSTLASVEGQYRV